jgi:hypothetical protein
MGRRTVARATDRATYRATDPTTSSLLAHGSDLTAGWRLGGAREPE